MFWLDTTARDLKVRAEYMMVEKALCVTLWFVGIRIFNSWERPGCEEAFRDSLIWGTTEPKTPKKLTKIFAEVSRKVKLDSNDMDQC